MNDVISVLRHYLATLAFRLRRVTDGAPEGFADFDAGAGVRSPLAILRHMSALMCFAQRLITSDEMPSPTESVWLEEIERFSGALKELDETLQVADPAQVEPLLRALQGPLADAMTHVGQLATLRRMAGAPLEPISYAKADIRAGVL